MKEYDDYLSSLYPKIGEIDQNVYYFLQKNCNDSDKTKLRNAYSLLFYAESALSTSLTNLINGGAQARANLNAMMESYQGFNVNAAMQRSRCSRQCPAESCTRMRAWPFGTTG